MATVCRCWTVRCGTVAAAVLGLLAGLGRSAETHASRQPQNSSNLGLVRAALESELAGDNNQRQVLLEKSIQESPDEASAHWQRGEVRIQGSWRSPKDVQRLAEQDRRLAEYRRLRDVARPTVEDQAGLARWCRKNGLNDEQWVHWMNVLNLQPDHPEALQAATLRQILAMRSLRGESPGSQSTMASQQKAMEHWRPQVLQWRTALEHGDPAPPSWVGQQIPKISNSTELLGLEQALWRYVGTKRQGQLYAAMVLAVVQTLGGNPHPAAAESLTRCAVFSDSEEIRSAAIEGLKRHPVDHYVPLLMASLESPIEVGAQYTLDPSGNLAARYSIYQEGALADTSTSLTVSPRLQNPTLFADADGQAKVTGAMARQINIQRSQAVAAADEAATRQSVDRTNQAIAQQNERITAVLRKTTGLDLGSEPTRWWKWWWQDYNSYALGRGTGTSQTRSSKPVHQYDYANSYVANAPNVPMSRVGTSGTVNGEPECFAPGTKVWTLTGLVAIETIQVGDRVLAQDPESGESAYKPVLAVTTREPGPRVKIGIEGETFVATPGHPLWVVGQGWRRAKDLNVGDRFHTLSGGLPITTVESIESPAADSKQAHNLVVADFNTYLVGEPGILVHDNAPRRPTSSLVPGLPATVFDGK